MLRLATPQDAPSIAEIYNHYVRETVITFEETEVSTEEIKTRIRSITSKYPWLVYEDNREIIGYAYATEWRSRSAYRFTAESAIYLKPHQAQKGIGTLLYQELLQRLRQQDIHVVMGVLTLPNPQSVNLHEKFGFKKVAHFSEVGFKFDQWVDVGYWQLTFD